jgi:hypothetical protein
MGVAAGGTQRRRHHCGHWHDGHGHGTTNDTDTDTDTAAETTARMSPTPVKEGGEDAKENGEDTHYVGFEGDRSRVVVINKKATVLRWLLGKAWQSWHNKVWAAYQLTPICTVLGAVSTVACFVAYTCFVRDKRLFLIPGIAGVGNWYNMLTSRSPRVIRILAKDFGEWGVWAGV